MPILGASNAIPLCRLSTWAARRTANPLEAPCVVAPGHGDLSGGAGELGGGWLHRRVELVRARRKEKCGKRKNKRERWNPSNRSLHDAPPFEHSPWMRDQTR